MSSIYFTGLLYQGGSPLNRSILCELNVPNADTLIGVKRAWTRPGSDTFSVNGVASNSSKLFITANSVFALPFSSNLSEATFVNESISWGGLLAANDDYVFVPDSNTSSIVKLSASDLSVLDSVSNYGSGSFSYPESVCFDSMYLYITDYSDNKLVKLNISDLSYVSQIGSFGTGNDQFDSPEGICTDGTYLYICDNNNNRIVKRLASDLSYVSQIGSYGAGNDQFDYPYGICTDGTYLYICDSNNNRIVKRLCSDLSYVSAAGFNSPYVITIRDSFLYIQNYEDAPIDSYVISKINSLDISFVENYATFDYVCDFDFRTLNGICTDGTYLYMIEEWTPGEIPLLLKFRIMPPDITSLSFVSSSEMTDFPTNTNYGMCTDGDNIFIAVSNESRIKKYSCLDLSYVSTTTYDAGGASQYFIGVACDDTYLYATHHQIVPPSDHQGRIVKFLKSDLSYVDSTVTLGDYVHGIDLDGDDLYASISLIVV